MNSFTMDTNDAITVDRFEELFGGEYYLVWVTNTAICAIKMNMQKLTELLISNKNTNRSNGQQRFTARSARCLQVNTTNIVHYYVCFE